MTKLIAILIIVAALFGGWKLFEYWETVKNDESDARKRAVSTTVDPNNNVNDNAFVLRDPSGIRPAFWFQDDEVVACASERVALMTVFEKEAAQIREVTPGHVVVVKKNGTVHETMVKEPLPRRGDSDLYNKS